jgi:hypothetical protein
VNSPSREKFSVVMFGTSHMRVCQHVRPKGEPPPLWCDRRLAET